MAGVGDDKEGRRRGRGTPKAGSASRGAGSGYKATPTGDAKSDRGAITEDGLSDEITEYESPRAGIPIPVEMHLHPKVMVDRWQINRILLFQAFVTIICLTAVVISPVTAVQIAAVSICLAGFAFARYLLYRNYRK